jgi:hypothetical protein
MAYTGYARQQLMADHHEIATVKLAIGVIGRL